MASAAVVGGFILALIEGMGIWMNNYFSMPPPGMEGTLLLCSNCAWRERRIAIKLGGEKLCLIRTRF